MPCGKPSLRYDNVLTHVRGFHFRIRYDCELCQRSFLYNTNLYTHIRVHKRNDSDAEEKRRALEQPERLTRRQAREAEERAQEEKYADEEVHDV